MAVLKFRFKTYDVIVLTCIREPAHFAVRLFTASDLHSLKYKFDTIYEHITYTLKPDRRMLSAKSDGE